jgi:hypothetical protein
MPHPAALAAVDDAATPLRVEVVRAVRLSPDVVELRVTLVNRDVERPLHLGERFAEHPIEAGTLSRSFLTTERGTSRYFVLRNQDGTPACSTDSGALAPGERRETWIRFASPAREGLILTLQLPGLPPLSGIELAAAAETGSEL